MITKTINLDSSYDSLFAEIKEKSQGQIDINNIESFFGNIEEIAAVDKKFLRLPLDEPMFEINANTRKIEIPAEFKSNGLSVQGDHLAETVFFSIDRYFDYTDLSDTDILINWKMGSETGKTRYFILSKDILPGKIVFGWPINNIITKKSGTLTFAVECNKTNDNDEVLYRFNTLAANINIKDGLIIPEDTEIVTLDNDILGSLQNSSFGEGEAAVGPVEWRLNLVTGGSPSGEAFSPNEFQSVLYLRPSIDRNTGEPSNSPIRLYGQAYVDNQTEIRYADGIGTAIEPTMISISSTLVPVDRENLVEGIIYYAGSGPSSHVATEEDLADEDITIYGPKPLDENLIYYVKISDEPVAYEYASEEQIAAWGTADQVALYSKVASITVSSAGEYRIKAQGQKFDNEGRKIGSGESSFCDTVTIPSVETPSGVNIVSSNDLREIENYEFDEDAISNVVFLVDDENKLIADAVIEHFGALQFVWQKEVEDEFVNISDSDVPYSLTNLSEYNVEDEGKYRVVVTNFQNFEYSDSVTSAEFIASELAGVITDAKCKYQANGEFVDFPANSNVVDFNSSVLSQSSAVLFIDEDDIVVDGVRGTFSFEWKKGNEIVGTEAQFAARAEGNYIPVIKNVYNGSIYRYELNPVFVNDVAND